MKWFSVFSYRTFYYRSIAALIIGIVALFVPNDTLNTLVMLIGAFIVISGIGTAYTAHKSGHNLLFSLGGTASVVSIIIGILLIAKPDFFLNMIVTLFGVLLIIVGLLQIINVANLRNEITHTKFYIAGGIIPIAVGALFLVLPEFITSIIGVVLGITLIVYALNELGLGFRMRKHFKPQSTPEEVSFEEVQE